MLRWMRAMGRGWERLGSRTMLGGRWWTTDERRKPGVSID